MLLATLGLLAFGLQQEPSSDFFRQLEGEWTVKGTFTSGDASRRLEGMETVERRMDGRWLVIEHRLEDGGKPYRGFCIMTFDPEKNTYSGTWMDDRSPKPGSFEGKAEGGALTMRPASEQAATRGARIARWVFEQKGENERVVRVFGDQDKPIAELHYARRGVAK